MRPQVIVCYCFCLLLFFYCCCFVIVFVCYCFCLLLFLFVIVFVCYCFCLLLFLFVIIFVCYYYCLFLFVIKWYLLVCVDRIDIPTRFLFVNLVCFYLLFNDIIWLMRLNWYVYKLLFVIDCYCLFLCLTCLTFFNYLSIRFTAFYGGQHSGRKLNWLYHMSKGELVTNCFRNR